MRFDIELSSDLSQSIVRAYDNNMLRKPFRCRHIVILPVLVAFALSILYLEKESIWLDEAYSIAFANFYWADLWSLFQTVDSNMSLYYSGLKVWILIFGDSEFAARILSVILALPAVAATHAVARRLFGAETALVASMLLAVNPLFIYYAQEARAYSLLISCSTVSIYLYLSLFKDNNWSAAFGLALVNALGMYVHYFSAFTVIVQVALMLAARGNLAFQKKVVVSFGISALLVIPLGLSVFLTLSSDPPVWDSTTRVGFDDFYRLVLAISGNGSLLLTVCYGLAATLGFVAATRKVLAKGNNTFTINYCSLLVWFFVPIGCLFLLSLFVVEFRIRYLISIVSPLAMLVAIGALCLRPIAVRYSAIAALLAFSVYGVVEQHLAIDKRNWRQAAQVVLHQSAPGDAIAFYSWVAMYPFEYHYRRHLLNGESDYAITSVWPAPFSWLDRTRGLQTYSKYYLNYEDPNPAFIGSLTGRHERLWVVLAMENSEVFGWNSSAFLGMVEKYYEVATVEQFNRFSIRLYQRRITAEPGS